jgi:hypothetical protein
MLVTFRVFSSYKRATRILYGTRDEVNAWLVRRKLDKLNESAMANFRVYPAEKNRESEGELHIISLIGGSGAVAEISALVHEITHHAIYVFDQIETTITGDHDEPFAYYVESIFHQALSGIAKRSRR